MNDAQYWTDISLGIATLSIIVVLIFTICSRIITELRSKPNK